MKTQYHQTINKNRVGIASVFAVLALLFASCIKEPLFGPSGWGNGNVKLYISIPERKIVTTRANDDVIDPASLYILVFDGDSDGAKITDWANALLVSQTGDVYSYVSSLDNTNDTRYIFLAVNAKDLLDAKSASWVKGSTTLLDVKNSLITDPLRQSSGVVYQQLSLQPMINTSPVILTKINNNTNIGTAASAVGLTRITASIQIANATAPSQGTSFELIGANLGGAADRGYLFFGMYNTANISRVSYGQDGNIENPIASGDSTDPLYCYESPADDLDGMYVIMKAKFKDVEGYYRLNIWQGTPKKNIEILRNHKYIVLINRVNNYGYRTASEAIKNPASNAEVDYNIEVVDPYSHDIVSNGVQHFGVSNSQLFIYQSGAINDLTATVVNYTVPSETDPAYDWLAGEIIVSGNGLSLTDTSPLGSKLSLTNTQNRDIKINITDAFTDGKITFQIGDLYKVVTITRHPTLQAVDDELSFADYVIADKTQSGAAKDYIMFSDVEGAFNNSEDRVFNKNGTGIYVLVNPNVGYLGGIHPRSGEFYLSSADEKGRAKVLFYQDKFDVFYQLQQIKPYTYVGTFHRWNETAERIIRIKAIDPDPNKTWTAMVLAGGDFIQLDTTRSPDPGITQYPYGYDEADPNNVSKQDNPIWTTPQEIEQTCQLRTNKQVVHGKGDKIYFRVGLKSRLSGPDADPRYGLIAVNHSGGSHLIYVRQGEREDYLMRPNDPINSDGVVMQTRPSARMIQPFNLTITDQSLMYSDVDENEGVLTDYPSKGGYLFKGNSNRAFDIFSSAGDVGWSSAPTSSINVCPENFRKPNDGLTQNDGEILNSEIRQTIFLNPYNGRERSSLANSLRGYIADGYYDRRMMRVADYGKNPYKGEILDKVNYTIPTVVGQGNELAFAGMLLFNPYNYASIFIPTQGTRNQTPDNGGIVDVGSGSSIWTTTPALPYGTWYLASGFYNVYSSGGAYLGRKYVLDNYSSLPSQIGLTVRCVRQPQNISN